MRSLDDWLRFQEQAYSPLIELGLDRLNTVLRNLGWRQPDVPVITVAGTNGKGSVCAYCEAMLRAAGHRVAMFTSPHLIDYRERIRLNGSLVGATELVAVFERIEAARAGVGITFFEYNTLAALLLFEDAQFDAWVLEVGLGGRLDAVNVVNADVGVVVSIGLDHQEYLGDTLEKIGIEKAGIFRQGNVAVLGGTRMPESVSTTARAVGAKLKRLGIEFAATREPNQRSWSYRGEHWSLAQIPGPALFGDQQYDNAATAIAAIESLQNRLPVPPSAIRTAIAATSLPGRFQILDPIDAHSPQWILDVAHNPAAARVLAQNLRASPRSGRTLAICAILSDKDAGGIIAELRSVIDEWWFASTVGARGSSAESLASHLRTMGNARYRAVGEVAEACAMASTAVHPQDRIVVFGSFLCVGPALAWLQSRDIHGYVS